MLTSSGTHFIHVCPASATKVKHLKHRVSSACANVGWSVTAKPLSVLMWAGVCFPASEFNYELYSFEIKI